MGGNAPIAAGRRAQKVQQFAAGIAHDERAAVHKRRLAVGALIVQHGLGLAIPGQRPDIVYGGFDDIFRTVGANHLEAEVRTAVRLHARIGVGVFYGIGNAFAHIDIHGHFFLAQRLALFQDIGVQGIHKFAHFGVLIRGRERNIFLQNAVGHGRAQILPQLIALGASLHQALEIEVAFPDGSVQRLGGNFLMRLEHEFFQAKARHFQGCHYFRPAPFEPVADTLANASVGVAQRFQPFLLGVQKRDHFFVQRLEFRFSL